MTRYYYSPTSTSNCVSMDFGGCLGNSNNFATPDSCSRACGSQGMQLQICYPVCFMNSLNNYLCSICVIINLTDKVEKTIVRTSETKLKNTDSEFQIGKVQFGTKTPISCTQLKLSANLKLKFTIMLCRFFCLCIHLWRKILL